MREIKFRAVNGENKIVVVLAIDFHNHLVSISRNKDGFIWQGLDTVILLQYTGMKDINDKEVYEGDICQNNNRKFSVHYLDEYAQFCFSPYRNLVRDPMVTGGLDYFAQALEVIGNIHENPELLKEQT